MTEFNHNHRINIYENMNGHNQNNIPEEIINARNRIVSKILEKIKTSMVEKDKLFSSPKMF